MTGKISCKPREFDELCVAQDSLLEKQIGKGDHNTSLSNCLMDGSGLILASRIRFKLCSEQLQRTEKFIKAKLNPVRIGRACQNHSHALLLERRANCRSTKNLSSDSNVLLLLLAFVNI